MSLAVPSLFEVTGSGPADAKSVDTDGKAELGMGEQGYSQDIESSSELFNL